MRINNFTTPEGSTKFCENATRQPIILGDFACCETTYFFITHWRLGVSKKHKNIMLPPSITMPLANWYCYPSTLAPLNPLDANPKKWSNTLKQSVVNLTISTNCLNVLANLCGWCLKGQSAHAVSTRSNIHILTFWIL